MPVDQSTQSGRNSFANATVSRHFSSWPRTLYCRPLRLLRLVSKKLEKLHIAFAVWLSSRPNKVRFFEFSIHRICVLRSREDGRYLAGTFIHLAGLFTLRHDVALVGSNRHLPCLARRQRFNLRLSYGWKEDVHLSSRHVYSRQVTYFSSTLIYFYTLN